MEIQRSGLTANDAVRIGRGVNARTVLFGDVNRFGESTYVTRRNKFTVRVKSPVGTALKETCRSPLPHCAKSSHRNASTRRFVSAVSKRIVVQRAASRCHVQHSGPATRRSRYVAAANRCGRAATLGK